MFGTAYAVDVSSQTGFSTMTVCTRRQTPRITISGSESLRRAL